MKKGLLTIMSRSLNILTTINMYKWSDEYRNKELDKLNKKIKDSLEELNFDFNKLDIETAEMLGFVKFSDEESLYLVPIWLYNVLPEGLELTSIFGSKVIVGKDNIDNDVRFGCIAFGLKIK